jgi:AAA domain
VKKNDKPEDRARYAKMTKEERLQSFKRTIAHPHLEAADKALREAIQETGGASLINVYGPARVGKSTMKNHVIRNIILEMLPLLEQDRERIPLLSLTPRPPMNSSFSWKDFFQRGLVAFDEPLIDHKIVIDTEEDEEQVSVARSKRKPPEGTKDALRQSFETAAKRRRLVAIFVDEAQHLGKVSGTQLQNQLDCIKSLADDTGTLIVLIGTYELLPLRNLSAQLIGRSLDIHFPRYRGTKRELSQFKNVLRTFQDDLPFVEETDVLLKHWEFCYERSIGCVGNLRLMLVRAVHAALWSDAKNLSWKTLQEHAFSEVESYEMMLEAYEGERELASKPEQRTKLRKMLGLDSLSKPKEETASEGRVSQGDHPDETKNDAKQELPIEEVTAEAAVAENLVLDDQPAETTNRVEPNVSIEEISTDGTSPKPLKKPKVEAPRPFRRKSKRDRTGGPPQKNSEKH